MLKIIFSCIIFISCAICYAGEPINYSFVPQRKVLRYSMQPNISYLMQPKILKPKIQSKTKPIEKKVTKTEPVTGYTCDETGCHPTTYRYRILRRR